MYHQYTIRVPGHRNMFVAGLKDRGVETRVYYPVPIHQQPVYARLGFGDVQLPVAERAANEVVSLPIHPGLTAEELARVAQAVIELWS